jgi:alpha/beta superfamily hydrolase
MLRVPEERRLEILAEDGTSLDARLAVPDGAPRAVVLAHPHPLYGGSMDDAVTVALARAFAELGAATLRFDFRGVGHSEGRHGGGPPEIGDLLGAVRAAQRHAPGLPISLCGYSFGSWVALQAARAHALPIDRVALLAPALALLDYERLPSFDGAARFEGPVAVVLGDRDAFSDPSKARALAGRVGASVALLSGEDHFFSRTRRRVAERLAPFVFGARDRVDEGDFA